MCSLFLEENEIIFTIFIEDYCGKARRAFVTLRMNSNILFAFYEQITAKNLDVLFNHRYHRVLREW